MCRAPSTDGSALPGFPVVTGKLNTHYFLTPFTVAFSVAPGLNAGTLAALIFSSSPVLGLRPMRAARLRTSNVPKPTSVSESPFFRVPEMMSISAPTARSASALVDSVLAARASTSYFLFMF